MNKLKSGDKAPSFALTDQDGEKISFHDYSGQKILLYFYPKAMTPGCTTQSCCVRDAAEELTKAGVVALGISPDKPDRLKTFDEKYTLGFRLLSDPDHQIAEKYGAWGEKSMYGKKVMGIVRSSFLIDEKGRILGAWYKIKPEETVASVMALL
ncbi:MAG: thioredoxin-dependent thiol peroxidase [Sedimentisphaerales bacterium]|nr:thioredoxin-dependent thiol peroxidase [Sedimentisphaerales bacterium]